VQRWETALFIEADGVRSRAREPEWYSFGNKPRLPAFDQLRANRLAAHRLVNDELLKRSRAFVSQPVVDERPSRNPTAPPSSFRATNALQPWRTRSGRMAPGWSGWSWLIRRATSSTSLLVICETSMFKLPNQMRGSARIRICLHGSDATESAWWARRCRGEGRGLPMMGVPTPPSRKNSTCLCGGRTPARRPSRGRACRVVGGGGRWMPSCVST
jgi:hypothetical protein